MISGRAPNEPSKIMQMIIDSKTTPKLSSAEDEGESRDDDDNEELSEINKKNE